MTDGGETSTHSEGVDDDTNSVIVAAPAAPSGALVAGTECGAEVGGAGEDVGAGDGAY